MVLVAGQGPGETWRMAPPLAKWSPAGKGNQGRREIENGRGKKWRGGSRRGRGGWRRRSSPAGKGNQENKERERRRGREVREEQKNRREGRSVFYEKNEISSIASIDNIFLENAIKIVCLRKICNCL